MGSSLLFRIKSVLDPSGFRSAKTAFTDLVTGIRTLADEASGLKNAFSSIFGGGGGGQRDALGVPISRATNGLSALTGGLVSLKTIGIASAVVGTVALVKGIEASTKVAAKSEVSFLRLSGQLEALGLATEENLLRVQRFAQQTAVTTRFSSGEVESAVAKVVKRTGDLDVSLRAVKISQDIAAGSGQDLASTSSQVTQALLGNVRAIKLLTGATNAEIQTAVRQNKVLDLLAKTSKGLAEKESQGLINKQKILANTFEEVASNVGKFFLPAAKAITDDLIVVGQAAVTVTSKIVQFGENAGKAFDKFKENNKTFAEFVSIVGQASNPLAQQVALLKGLAEEAKKATEASSNFSGQQFSLTEEIEKQNLIRNTAIEDRGEKERQFARAQEVARAIERGQLQQISKARLEEARQFDFVKKAETSGLETLARAREEEFKKTIEKNRKLAESRKKGTGTNLNLDSKAIANEETQIGKALGESQEQINVRIQTRLGLLKEETAELNKQLQIQSQRSEELAKADGLLIRKNQTEVSTDKGQTDRVQQIAQSINASLKPLEPVINFNIDPLALGAKMAEVARQEINRFLASVKNNNRAVVAQNGANSSAS